jgi:murein DD-endopeptidase MepM/ murein hydrolase activator NlpD
VSGRFVVGTTDGQVSRAARISIAPVPVVSRTACIRSCGPSRIARSGSVVLVRGVRLADVGSATLYGRPGRADDRRARVSHQRFGSFRLRVPAGAVSGRLSARGRNGSRSPGSRIRLAAPAPVDPSGVFPVAGPHDYGGAGARFGTGRAGHSHQGHDVFARCGTPMVAARGGLVKFRGYHRAAGNYIVIDGAGTTYDYAYMHLAEPTPFEKGDIVYTGQRIGAVGATGNARTVGCHLHFEIRVHGHPIDPEPLLRRWDRAGDD